MEKIGICKYQWYKGIYIFFFILSQVCICILFGYQKKTFFCDEIYSYGLANCEEYTWIDYESSKSIGENGWVTREYYSNYVVVDDNSKLSFKAAYDNQVNDVHPPFYYFLLHFLCFIFAGRFTKWIGIGLNLAILVLLDLVFFYITDYLYEGALVKSLLTVALWSFSAAGLSNILFIRMYLLLTLLILSYVAIHIYASKKSGFSIKVCFTIFLCVICGGLTHYYFYVYAFFFSAVICIYLLAKRKVKELFFYILDLCIAFLTNLLAFPATIKHVFSGYRGTEVLNNLSTDRSDCYEFYKRMIDQSFFAGSLNAIAIFGIMIFLYMAFVKIIWRFEQANYVADSWKKFSHKDVVRVLLLWSTFVATLGFIHVAIIGSELKSNRYIYPIYPFFALGMISVIYWLIEKYKIKTINKMLISVSFVLFFCIGSIKKYHIDFLYPEYEIVEEKVKAIKGRDCLQYEGEEWTDMYTALPLRFNYDESFFFKEDDITNLNEILLERETKNDLIVCFPSSWSYERSEVILKQIIDVTNYSDYQLVYDFYSKVYELY